MRCPTRFVRVGMVAWSCRGFGCSRGVRDERSVVVAAAAVGMTWSADARVRG